MRRSALVVGLLWALAAPAVELPRLSYNPAHAEVLRFCVAAAAHPSISVASLGTSVRGKQIPVVILHDPTVAPLEVPRILILARQHGNEPAGTMATLGYLREVASGSPRLVEQLRRICVLLVPLVNPDGADADRRHNANDADLNRDWVTRRQPETQAVERLFQLWTPTVVLDLHELHWQDKYGLNTIEAPEPGVVIEPLGAEARDLQALILNRLQLNGFNVRFSSWDGSNHPGLCHRHFARDHNRVALLFESERQNLKTPLPRRTEMHRLGLQVVLDYYEREGFGRQQPRLALAPPGDFPAVSDAGGLLAESPGAGWPESEPSAPIEPRVLIAQPDPRRPLPPTAVLQIELTGIDDLKYLAVRVDGQGRYFANRGPFRFALIGSQLPPGKHVILLQAYRQDGRVVEREYVVEVTAEPVGEPAE